MQKRVFLKTIVAAAAAAAAGGFATGCTKKPAEIKVWLRTTVEPVR